MAKPNYQAEKRRRDLEKKKKQDEKRMRKIEEKRAKKAGESGTDPAANPESEGNPE